MHAPLLLLPLAAALTACAGRDTPAVEGARTVVVSTAPDTLVSSASGGIGGASDLAVGPDGDVYVLDGQASRVLRPTHGSDTALAFVQDAEGSVVGSVGHIQGEPSRLIRVRSMKEAIGKGEIPSFFLNATYGAFGSDGAVWLWAPGRGAVARYGATGALLDSLTLDEPGFPSVLEDFRARNADPEGMSFAGLDYILDAVPAGPDLAVLLGSSRTGAAAVRMVRRGGTLGPRIEVPGVTGAVSLAVDPDRGRLYLYVGDTAELFGVSVDPGLF